VLDRWRVGKPSLDYDSHPTLRFVKKPKDLSQTAFMTSTTMDVEHLTSSNRNFPKKKCGKYIHAAIENRSDSDPGVLGATGVGQRFILLLALHLHFELHVIGASERSAGKKYKNAVKWKQALLFTERIGNLIVKQCTPDEFKDCDLIFSGDVGKRI
jgi:aspartate-semialdehyde dehydrogenase